MFKEFKFILIWFQFSFVLSFRLGSVDEVIVNEVFILSSKFVNIEISL